MSFIQSNRWGLRYSLAGYERISECYVLIPQLNLTGCLAGNAANGSAGHATWRMVGSRRRGSRLISVGCASDLKSLELRRRGTRCVARDGNYLSVVQLECQNRTYRSPYRELDGTSDQTCKSFHLCFAFYFIAHRFFGTEPMIEPCHPIFFLS
jgi:hypothetical protein